MPEITNQHYIVAVNSDNSYPLKRTSHIKNGQPHPEVQDGYLTLAHVIPDGQVMPDITLSLYNSGKLWDDIKDLTWQEVNDTYLW